MLAHISGQALQVGHRYFHGPDSDAITNVFELILIVTLMLTAIRFSNEKDGEMY